MLIYQSDDIKVEEFPNNIVVTDLNTDHIISIEKAEWPEVLEVLKDVED